MSMYIQSFLAAKKCAEKINEILSSNVPADLKIRAVLNVDPRGYELIIKVDTVNYPSNSIMKQIADLASPILSEYTGSNKEITFYRSNKDRLVVKVSGAQTKELSLTV